MFRSRRIWLATLAAVLLVLCVCAWWLGRRRGAPAGTAPILIVLRISPQVLAPLVDRPFEWNSPVQETVLGADVTGASKASGKVSLELLPDSKEAILQIVLHGQSIAQTIAAEGPARVRSQSRTPFVAKKRILLDAKGFRSLPAEVEAHARTQVEGVGSTLPGVRGRIVERVAQRRAEQARPVAEHVAEDDVIRQVADAFDKAVDDHLATLNRTAIFPEIFSDAAGQDRSPAIHFATTKDCLKVIITVQVGKPHGLPSVEPGDRGPVVAYLNCMELGERPARSAGDVRAGARDDGTTGGGDFWRSSPAFPRFPPPRNWRQSAGREPGWWPFSAAHGRRTLLRPAPWRPQRSRFRITTRRTYPIRSDMRGSGWSISAGRIGKMSCL